VRAPKGTQRSKASWLCDHHAAGILTPDAVASVLAIQPHEVELIASGKIALANTSWEKLAALVASRTRFRAR
jgi:hypothetical protein